MMRCFCRGMHLERYVELLAPAGSPEALYAAVNAGADAVYLGGTRFGARAYAGNFDDAQLREALEYAHVRGRRVYMTINTLVKDEELDGLPDYLEPFYRDGLDAVIVQDFGVFDLVRECFPEMDIHASTQMNITGSMGARLLKEMGASRIVPARELSLSDIRAIDRAVDIEIETFVHGALCYGYSGQCLLSSMHGDRSGNRGRCAQPCRMQYECMEKQGGAKAGVRGGSSAKCHPLSLKDMCTLDMLPDIVGAGVDSLKIEGRVKNSGYVATVVSMCLAGDGYSVSEDDICSLMDAYNRGGFSGGYYKGVKGREMVSLERPNHQGTQALRVVSQSGQDVLCEALEEINPGDVMELGADFNYTYGENVPRGGSVRLHLPKNYRLAPGRVINRTRNEALLREMNEKYVQGKCRVAVSGFARLVAGERARLVVWRDNVCHEALGEIVSDARKCPLTQEDVHARLGKTGESDFYFQELEVELDGEVFLSVGQLNALKRDALQGFRKAWLEQYARGGRKCAAGVAGPAAGRKNEDRIPKVFCHLDYALAVDGDSRLQEVLDAICRTPVVAGVYLEEEAYESTALLKRHMEKLKDSGKEAFIALPHVIREDTGARLSRFLDELGTDGADGFLVHNLEAAALLRYRLGEDVRLVADYGIYAMNRRAQNSLKAVFPCMRDTANVELDRTELERLGVSGSELVVYGHMTLACAENCVHATLNGCDRSYGRRKLKGVDRSLWEVSRCKDCYTTLQDDRCLWLLDEESVTKECAPYSIRLCFTNEDSTMVNNVIESTAGFLGGRCVSAPFGNTTKGHYPKGSKVR
jgi:putative protease